MVQTNEEHEVVTYQNAGRLAISAIAYPIENAKTLIQMGHEPIPPFATRTLFGSPAFGLPNVFTYVKHIYKVDGLAGCYRGFYPWISTSLVYRYSLNKMKDTFPVIANEDRNEDDLDEEERLTLFASVLYRGVVCRAVAVVVSQPLHVITVRSIAQFVGHETKYSGVFSPFWTVLKEEGIIGFFSGVLPRLLCDIFIYTVATTGVYLAHEYMTKDKEVRKMMDTVIQYVASAAFYPLTVVGTCMAVTNSGLAAGSPPNMPHYYHMYDCWRHLHSIHQHKRGSSILWRYHSIVPPKGRAGQL